MTDLPRFKPDPVPRLHPLPEYLASGARKAVYEDTKAVLGVPWMGVVTMAFSHYPVFYRTLWQGARPLCSTPAFREACVRLRVFSEAQAAGFDLSDLRPRLADMGYAPRELSDIGELIEVFSRGNMPYLMLATLARRLLNGLPLDAPPPAQADVTDVADVAEHPAPLASARLLLMERHHADAATVAVYDDIQSVLGLPFVNTDYRALARWPSYFALAWADLRPVIMSPGYAASVQAIHHQAQRLVAELPNPGALMPDALQAAAQTDAPGGEVLRVVELFQWLLPGLAANVAGFRRQLGG